jgi:hypothetical protein
MDDDLDVWHAYDQWKNAPKKKEKTRQTIQEYL